MPVFDILKPLHDNDKEPPPLRVGFSGPKLRRFTFDLSAFHRPNFMERFRSRLPDIEPHPEILFPEFNAQWVTLTFEAETCTYFRKGGKTTALLKHIARLIKTNENCEVTNRCLNGYGRLSIKVVGMQISGENARRAASNIVKTWIKRYPRYGRYFSRQRIFSREYNMF